MKKILVAAVLALSTGTLEAKGLDDLTPEVEPKAELKEVPPEQPPATDVKASEPAAAPAQPTTPAPATPGTPVPPAAAPAPAGDTSATATEKAPEPSETSKKLADRLVLHTGASFTQVSGPNGDWGGGGAGDLSASWLLKKDPFPNGRLAKIDLYALVRYSPQDVVVKSKGQSYRGITQTYQGGFMTTRPASETLRYVTHATLGFVTTKLTSLDPFTERKSLQKGGVHFGFGGGCDWLFGNKVSVGPRLNLGFGRYQTIGLGGEFGFVF